MKIFIVFKAECIYNNSFDKAFRKLKDAQKYVDENIEQYLVYLSDKTLTEIYEIVIQETELIDSDIFLETSQGTREKLNDNL